MAADLLNHGEFVRKVACVSHSQRALERYYVYNTSYKGVVTNSAPGDHCTRYQVVFVFLLHFIILLSLIQLDIDNLKSEFLFPVCPRPWHQSILGAGARGIASASAEPT